MALPRTDYFDRVLQYAYGRLQMNPLTEQYLSGSFRKDGAVCVPGTEIELDAFTLTSAEFAQLLMVFDGARVHQQAQYQVGSDASPPGEYFTSVQPALLQHPHKTRVGIYEELGDAGLSLFVEDVVDPDVAPEQDLDGVRAALHIDHLYLRHQAPDWLGTIAFALCAITAHCLGYRRITLVAGGGVGYDQRMIGYRYWPKLGFDAPLEEQDAEIPAFADCNTVLDVMAHNEPAWAVHGSQRLMEFDLSPESRSWRKLLDYLREKELV